MQSSEQTAGHFPPSAEGTFGERRNPHVCSWACGDVCVLLSDRHSHALFDRSTWPVFASYPSKMKMHFFFWSFRIQHLFYPTPEKWNPPSSPILYVFTRSNPAALERESLKKKGLKFILQLELILKACYKEWRRQKSYPQQPLLKAIWVCDGCRHLKATRLKITDISPHVIMKLWCTFLINCSCHLCHESFEHRGDLCNELHNNAH